MKGCVLVLVAACGAATTTTVPGNKAHMTEPISVSSRSPNEWAVTVTRSLGERSATAEVVTIASPTSSEPAPHHAVASAAAWLAVARQSMEARAFTDAITAARNGIADLGVDYKVRKIKDDTELHIGEADDEIAKGQHEQAASELVTVLDTRVALYFQAHASSVHQSRVSK